MQPDPGKIQSVQEWPLPTNVTALKNSFWDSNYNIGDMLKLCHYCCTIIYIDFAEKCTLPVEQGM